MGNHLKDYQFGADQEGGIFRGIRLTVGQKSHGRHDPSPYVSSRDVWALWWAARRQAALPESLSCWWLTLAPVERDELLQYLARLSLLYWLGCWWEARGTDPGRPTTQPDQPRDELRASP